MRSEDASTLTLNEPTRFVWMIGCVLQDACDNMPGILIFKLKPEVIGEAGDDASSKSTRVVKTYAGLKAEQRWR